MARHPKGHDCPDDQKYDTEQGRCVNKGETVIDTDYPEHRNISSSNLEFTIHKKREVT